MLKEMVKKKTPSRVQKRKRRKIILLSVFGVFLLLFSISLLNILFWSVDTHNNEKLKKELQDITKIELKPAEVGTFWDTDISALKEKNSDTIGWLHMNETEINYPFVQADDNSYYLYRDFNKASSNAGWIFMDYRNRKDLKDKNIILYGHNRTNKAMFGSLGDILKNEWIKNEENYYIQTSTEHDNRIWKVFSVYQIETTSDYLQINFTDDNEFMNFIALLKNRSNHDFNVEVTKDDQILTLSTCHGENHRTAVHAKLIESKQKEN